IRERCSGPQRWGTHRRETWSRFMGAGQVVVGLRGRSVLAAASTATPFLLSWRPLPPCVRPFLDLRKIWFGAPNPVPRRVQLFGINWNRLWELVRLRGQL